MIKMYCGHCGQQVSAPDSAAGKKAKCPKCGAIVNVMAPSGVAVGTKAAKPRVEKPCAVCGKETANTAAYYDPMGRICKECHAKRGGQRQAVNAERRGTPQGYEAFSSPPATQPQAGAAGAQHKLLLGVAVALVAVAAAVGYGVYANIQAKKIAARAEAESERQRAIEATRQAEAKRITEEAAAKEMEIAKDEDIELKGTWKKRTETDSGSGYQAEGTATNTGLRNAPTVEVTVNFVGALLARHKGTGASEEDWERKLDYDFVVATGRETFRNLRPGQTRSFMIIIEKNHQPPEYWGYADFIERDILSPKDWGKGMGKVIFSAKVSR